MQFTKALQYTIGWKALNTLLTFFINLLLVRILGVDESGYFFYAITLLSFFTLVISWSMEAGITYYASINNDKISSVLRFILPLLLFQAVTGWVLLYFFPVSINWYFSWSYILSNLAIIYFSALYYAKKWFVPVNLIVCIANSIVLLVLVWYYLARNHDQGKIVGLLQGNIAGQPNGSNNSNGKTVSLYDLYFAGFVLQAVLLAVVFLIKSRFSLITSSFNFLLARKIFLYSSIAFISNILFFLVTRIDYYFVQKFCSEIALSNYVQVSKLGQLLVLLPSMMAGVIFPYSAGLDSKEYIAKLQALCRFIGLLFIPAAFAIVLIGYWLFPWLFGAGFTLMYPAMLLYLPGFYFLSLVTMMAAHLAGRSMLIDNLKASALALLAVIAGDLLLIPLGSIYAAAAVSSIAYFLCMVYLLGVYKNKLGCKTFNFLVPGRMDVQLLVNRFKK